MIARVLLSFSLFANVGIGWMLWTARDDGAVRAVPAPPSASSATTNEEARQRTGESPPAASGRAMDASDVGATLRRLGFAENLVALGVRAFAQTERARLTREFLAQNSTKAWWHHGVTGPAFSSAQAARLRELQKAEEAVISRAVGMTGSALGADAERYSFLPPDKASRLAALQKDYEEMRATIPKGARGEVSATQQLLDEQYQRDLAAFLAPADRREVELRTSGAARLIADRAPYFDGTESEFTGVYDILKTSRPNPALDGAMRVTDAQLAEIKTALGDERFKQWQMADRADYRALIDLQRRHPISPEVFRSVSDMPTRFAEMSQRVFDDPKLSGAEKMAAARRLSEEAKTEVRAVLGDSLGDAYNQASSRVWLGVLERGSAISFDGYGRVVIRAAGPTKAPPSSPNAPNR